MVATQDLLATCRHGTRIRVRHNIMMCRCYGSGCPNREVQERMLRKALMEGFCYNDLQRVGLYYRNALVSYEYVTSSVSGSWHVYYLRVCDDMFVKEYYAHNNIGACENNNYGASYHVTVVWRLMLNRPKKNLCDVRATRNPPGLNPFFSQIHGS